VRYVQNPPNPYLNYSAEFLGEPPNVKLEVFEEHATKSIITKNDSPDVGFKYSVNCYRGCQHGCTYCFARPYHEFLGYGAGTDFETKIVVKVKAVELIRQELTKKSMRGESLNFSFTTDPYLPLEASYELTRGCLIACRDFRNPVGIVTKAPLVIRDIDVLKDIDAVSGAAVYITIPFTTLEKSKLFEPFAPNPDARFKAMKTLTDAGIKVGIAIAPVIPGYNESDIPLLLEKAHDHGATGAFMTLLRLPTESLQKYFVSRLEEKAPTKASKILNQIRRERKGKLNSSVFGERMSGTTEQWKLATNLFNLNYKKFGYGFDDFVRPRNKTVESIPVQQSLFD
jgi:DNA repair photolyase